MKIRLFLALTLSMLLLASIFPIYAGDPPTLSLMQAQACEPGQDLHLTLSLSKTQLAGGFLELQYDTALFSLTSITLLQATDALTLTYAQADSGVRILLDAAQNAAIEGALLSISLASSEEIQPAAYSFACIVPEDTSFYALRDDGSTYGLSVASVTSQITVSTPTLPICPAKYLACQETDPHQGFTTLRVCALVTDTALLSDGKYGFLCTVTDSDGTRELTLDGAAPTDEITGGSKTYTKEMLGGSIYTATLLICAVGEVRITLCPFVYIDGQTLYGGSYTLIYQDGIYEQTTFS